MPEEILNLEPKRLWYYFNEICKIPRGSYNEVGIKDYIVGLAEKWGLEYQLDKAGNLVVRKGATAGNLASKPLVLQGHLDMICEKAEGVTHDFGKDPIKPRIVGEWVTADGTTLGADNGIGLAAVLAILEDSNIKHGPIEGLFTVDEEPGLFGAQDFDGSMFHGRTMINLDAEEDGVLYVGSSGAFALNITTSIARETIPTGYRGMALKISGLKGGHSGLVIHEQRGNALKILGRILYHLGKSGDVVLDSLDGGTVQNVIPSLAVAKVAVEKNKYAELEKLIQKLAADIKAEFDFIDPGLEIAVSSADIMEVLSKSDSDKLIIAMQLIPNGVATMSHDIKDLVQTSSNFAVMKTERDRCKFILSSRSSSNSELAAKKDEALALANFLKAEVEINTEILGWFPNMSSKILSLVKGTYKELFDEEPKVTAIHASLECGVLGSKVGVMDMVSFGPQLENVHSPKERAHIKSTEKFFKWLVKSIETFARS